MSKVLIILIIVIILLLCQCRKEHFTSKKYPIKELPIDNYFVISMETEEARRRYSKMKNSILGRYIEKVNAVNGKEVNLGDYIRKGLIKKDWDVGSFKEGRPRLVSMSPGEIGCGLSHRKIWQKMVDQDIEVAMVLEDDALNFDPNFIKKVKSIFNKLPSDWGILLLGFWLHRGFNGHKVNDIIYRVYNFALTHCYIINKKTAKYFLDRAPIDCPIDTWMSKFSKTIKIYRHNYLLDPKYLNNASSLIVQDFNYGEIDHTN